MQEKLVPVYSSAAPPFPTAIMASSYTLPMGKSLGIESCFRHFYCAVENRQSTWFFPKGQTEEVAQKVIGALLKNPAVVEKIEKNFLEASGRLLNQLKPEPWSDNYSGLPDSGLLELFDKAIGLYREATYAVEPPYFSFEIRGCEIAKEMFLSHAKQKRLGLRESELSDLFAVLSNPVKRTFVAESELDLLKIALAGGKPGRDDAIRSHVRNYYWLAYDYYGPVLDEKAVQKELAELEKLPEEKLRERIQSIEGIEGEARKRLDAALEKAALPEQLDRLFSAIRALAFLYSDTKKERISRASVGLGIILKEIGRRKGIKEEELHYASVSEIDGLLKGRPLDQGILRKRMKKSWLVVEKGGYRFIEEKDVLGFGRMKKQKDTEVMELVKGMSACPGYYLGRARVILDKGSMDEFLEGEVLVTPMTAVDFVPVMKRAGAIVTDLGGITCHAAIVSRELGVPCIVGTSNATKAIRTGDLVEVKANHGIVKIIGRDKK